MSKCCKVKDASGDILYFQPYFPVGSVYISVSDINPATYFGGTWERIKGRFLLGSDDSSYKLGNTGR